MKVIHGMSGLFLAGLLGLFPLTSSALAQTTFVSISANSSVALPGQPVIFTVTEAFVGNGYNVGHDVYATVPHYTSVSQADSGGASCSSGTWPCLAGQQLIWSSVQTVNQQTQSRQFTATVSSSGPPPAGALLSSVVTTGISGSGSASTSVLAAVNAGLQLEISSQSSVVAPGGSLVYNLTYSNTSSAAIAADLVVTLAPEVSFVSATNGGKHDTTAGVVQWTLGSLAARTAGQVALTVKVSNPVRSSPLINTVAQLTNPMSSASLARASDTAQALANPTQLSISSTGSPVISGQSMIFTVTEAFVGSGYNAGHNLDVTVPAYTSVAQANSGGADCSSGTWPCLAGQQLIWSSVQTIDQQTQSRQFAATVSNSLPPPGGALLSSVVTTDISGSGSASTSFVAPSKAGLQLAISAQSSVVAPGASLVYTLSYSNASDAAIAADLVVTLPAEVSFVSATNSGTHNAITGVVQWTLGTLAAGAAGQVELTVKVSDPLSGSPLVNTVAQLINPASSGSLAQASNTAEALANPTPVSISSAGTPVQPGQSVIFTVTEAFVGAGYNDGHNIYATVPDFTTVAKADVSTGATCSSGTWPCLAGQQVYWHVQTDSLQTQSMQFAATASSSSPPPAGALLSSVVTTNISGSGSASTSVVAASKAGLQLGISAQLSVVAPGGSLVYTLTYSNASDAAIAADLVVTLPTEATFVSATNSGVHNTTTGVVQWSLGNVAAGAAGQVALTVKVTSPLSASTLTNTVAQLINPTSLDSLAQASYTTVGSLDETLLSVSALAASGAIKYSVMEHYAASAGYNVANYVAVTVPAYTQVAQGSVSITCASGYCSTVTCSSGTWPCLAGQQLTAYIQTDAGQTQHLGFTATISTSSPPPKGKLVTSVVTGNQSGIGYASVNAVIP